MFLAGQGLGSCGCQTLGRGGGWARLWAGSGVRAARHALPSLHACSRGQRTHPPPCTEHEGRTHPAPPTHAHAHPHAHYAPHPLKAPARTHVRVRRWRPPSRRAASRSRPGAARTACCPSGCPSAHATRSCSRPAAPAQGARLPPRPPQQQVRACQLEGHRGEGCVQLGVFRGRVEVAAACHYAACTGTPLPPAEGGGEGRVGAAVACHSVAAAPHIAACIRHPPPCWHNSGRAASSSR